MPLLVRPTISGRDTHLQKILKCIVETDIHCCCARTAKRKPFRPFLVFLSDIQMRPGKGERSDVQGLTVARCWTTVMLLSYKFQQAQCSGHSRLLFHLAADIDVTLHREGATRKQMTAFVSERTRDCLYATHSCSCCVNSAYLVSRLFWAPLGAPGFLRSRRSDRAPTETPKVLPSLYVAVLSRMSK